MFPNFSKFLNVSETRKIREQAARFVTLISNGQWVRMKEIQKIPAAALSVVILSLTICACDADTFTASPTADAFVGTGPTGNLSGDNFGAAGALSLAAGDLPQGEFQTVIQFNLSGAVSAFNAEFGAGQWTIQSVTLDLTSSAHGNSIFNAAAAGLFGISLMQNNSWVEGTGTGGKPTTDGITYNSLQNVYINNSTDQALGTFNFGGGSSGENSYLLGLASGLVSDVQNGGDASLRLFPDDNNVSYLFSSRENGNGPQLVITAVPEPNAWLLALEGAGLFYLPRLVRKCRAS
jgi:hypothetical protein